MCKDSEKTTKKDFDHKKNIAPKNKKIIEKKDLTCTNHQPCICLENQFKQKQGQWPECKFYFRNEIIFKTKFKNKTSNIAESNGGIIHGAFDKGVITLKEKRIKSTEEAYRNSDLSFSTKAFGYFCLVTCSMLSKEQGIMVVFVCLLYDVFIHNKMKTSLNLRNIFAHVSVCVCVFVCLCLFQ